MQQEDKWREEVAEVAQECLNFWPVPDTVFASFADLVLALGFRAMGDLIADQQAGALAAAFAQDHLSRGKSRLDDK